MKVAIFDCSQGIAGDMTVGAFLDAGMSFGLLKKEIAKLKLTGCRLKLEKVKSGAFQASKFSVVIDPRVRRRHTSLREIEERIRKSRLHPDIQKKAISIFRALGRAEARVHGTPLHRIHFHEVGAVDSIVDIVGTAACCHHLKIGRAFVRHITVGRGATRGAHGRMPIPVPGAYELLKGFRLTQSDHAREMVTPTGAAILAVLCRKNGGFPKARIEAIGYGAGDRTFHGHRGLLRISLGKG